MKNPSKTSALPLPIKRVLKKLGRDLKEARLRRRISTEIMSKRAFISRMTLNKVEKGEPGVSISTYATVLFALGMIDRFGDIADPRFDNVGLMLGEEQLPKRIRKSQPFPKKKHTKERK